MPAKFSKSEAIKFGWSVMKANFLFFLGILLTILVINIVFNGIVGLFKKAAFLYMIFSLGLIAIGLIMNMGLIKIVIKFYDKQKPEFADLFKQYHLIIKYFLASLVYGLAVAIGLLLFIVPGIYLGIKMQFYGYFIVDKKMGTVESLKASWGVTKGSFWNLFLFGLLCFGINLLGILAIK